MSIFKCKMCGGSLEIAADQTTAVCEYCGTEQTLPKLDNDRRANLYDRANHFRRNNDFDKAMGIYEQILSEGNADAEAYWSMVLCEYGIEYVEDPATHKRVPTVNRAQFTSIFDDENYKTALVYADGYQKSIYEAEARAINEIQKGILAISQKEEPFDVFICYKETDNNGRRTPDSVLANDLYHQLTAEGFKVFFSRITLEDKLGVAYEPYIFAALNSARVMVALGTRPEYFKAVWVKNEWSRYLALVKKSGGKKVLIPAYKDMDPYDLPEEFSHLQAQDMGKLGFMQDLIRGMKKVLDADKKQPAPASVTTQVIQSGNANIDALIKRGNIALEDGEWRKADDFFDRVLDLDAECAEAYLGKALVGFKVANLERLAQMKDAEQFSYSLETLLAGNPDRDAEQKIVDTYQLPGYLSQEEIKESLAFDFSYPSAVSSWKQEKRELEKVLNNRNLLRAEQYGSAGMKATISNTRQHILSSFDLKIEQATEIAASSKAEILEKYAQLLQEHTEIRELWAVAEAACEADYQLASSELEKGNYEWARKQFVNLKQCNYRNASELMEECDRRIAKAQAKTRKKITVAAIAVVTLIAAFLLLTKIIIPEINYRKADSLLEQGKNSEAYQIFTSLNDYRDSGDRAIHAKYDPAFNCMRDEKYLEAIQLLIDMGEPYNDFPNFIKAEIQSAKLRSVFEARRIMAALDIESKYDMLELAEYISEVPDVHLSLVVADYEELLHQYIRNEGSISGEDVLALLNYNNMSDELSELKHDMSQILECAGPFSGGYGKNPYGNNTRKNELSFGFRLSYGEIRATPNFNNIEGWYYSEKVEKYQGDEDYLYKVTTPYRTFGGVGRNHTFFFGKSTAKACFGTAENGLVLSK